LFTFVITLLSSFDDASFYGVIFIKTSYDQVVYSLLKEIFKVSLLLFLGSFCLLMFCDAWRHNIHKRTTLNVFSTHFFDRIVWSGHLYFYYVCQIIKDNTALCGK